MTRAFRGDTPTYVSIRDEQFCIDGKLHSHLRVLLHGYQPIRKRFAAGRLLCHSTDAKRSRSGEFCAFCAVRSQCQRKVRLSLVHIDGAELEPVVFDLNERSFAGLQLLLDADGDGLRERVLQMKLVYDDADRKYVEFRCED